jgi:hypothetical protein
MPGTVLGDVASRCCFTWLLSLPTWGLMWTGKPTPIDVSYALHKRTELSM